MPRKNQIGLFREGYIGRYGYSIARPPDFSARCYRLKRMVTDKDFIDLWRQPVPMLKNPFEILYCKATSCYRPTMSCRQTLDTDHFVFKRWSQIFADEMLVARQWVCHSQPQIPQRNIMISGNHQFGKIQLIQKAAGLSKLSGLRPLSQISRDNDQMRLASLNFKTQRVQKISSKLAKMEV